MSYPPAGSLKDYALEWEQIGAPPTIVRWIKRGIRTPRAAAQPFRLNNLKFSEVETSFIDLACKAIEKCDTEPLYLFPLHCVGKKGGKHRLILNLRHLNSYVQAPRFRNEDIREVANFVRNDDLLISVDIRNGLITFQFMWRTDNSCVLNGSGPITGLRSHLSGEVFRQTTLNKKRKWTLIVL